MPDSHVAVSSSLCPFLLPTPLVLHSHQAPVILLLFWLHLVSAPKGPELTGHSVEQGFSTCVTRTSSATITQELVRHAHSQALPQTWGWVPAISRSLENCRKRGELLFRHHSSSAAGEWEAGVDLREGGNVLSQSQQLPPTKSLPHLFPESRGLDQQAPLFTPFEEGTSLASSWRHHRSRVCKAAHSPASFPPAPRPSFFPPSPGAPPPHPPAAPLSANLSPSQDEPRASASQSVLYLQDIERGL